MSRRHNPKKHRLPPFNQNGILLVDKPKDWTSHDVVNFVRMRFNVPKVGHCGTLDPAATGLLVLVLNRFTKLSQKFSGEDKVYDATILLGTETDSQDMEGEVIAENDYDHINEKRFMRVVKSFIGEQLQVPPMTSAVKQDGKKLYELARKGVEIERKAKEIFIEEIDVHDVDPPYADFTVSCSKGTYIRTLCSDIGHKLGCGAALYALNRTQSGSFDLADAVSIETIKTWEQDDLKEWMVTFLHNKVQKMKKMADF